MADDKDGFYLGNSNELDDNHDNGLEYPECDQDDEFMSSLFKVRKLTPEQEKAQEEEILAFEAQFPGYHLERSDYDPKNPRKGTAHMAKPPVKATKRKSRKKPLFWTRPKD
jgi:hypothetical protein